MRIFSADSYEIFDNAVATTDLGRKKLEADFNSIIMELDKITVDVFLGPCCSTFIDGWNVIRPLLYSSVNELNNAIVGLQVSKMTYQLSDNTNASEIGGVGNGS